MKSKLLRSLAALTAALCLLTGCASSEPQNSAGAPSVSSTSSSAESNAYDPANVQLHPETSDTGAEFSGDTLPIDNPYDPSKVRLHPEQQPDYDPNLNIVAEEDFWNFSKVQLHPDGQTSDTSPSESSSDGSTSVTTGSGLIFPSTDNNSGTASSSSTTSASQTAPVKVENEPKFIDGINNESIIEYTTYSRNYIQPISKSVYLSNFSRSLSMGFGVDGTVLPTEADYGIKAYLDGTTIRATIYDNAGGHSYTDVLCEGVDNSVNKSLRLNVAADGTFYVTTGKLTNGLYALAVNYTNGKTLKLCFYVNGDDVYLCEVTVMGNDEVTLWQKRRNAFLDVIKNGNVTPDNSITMDKVWYPFPAISSAYRCDTDRWVALSNTFINDSWSDEYKLYKIQEWLRENIAYDKYKADHYRYSRAVINNCYTGEYSVYNLRTGVCYDFGNIVAIMCRAHGIPAITLGTEDINHLWNAAYVNNRWIEFDVTRAAQYFVKGLDTTVRTRSGFGIYDCFYDKLQWTHYFGSNSTVYPTNVEANRQFQQNSYVAR